MPTCPTLGAVQPPLPPYGPERIALYRLYHALELWTWFTSTGETARLPGLVNSLLRA
jgi:hygromycin-B 7''-O-kinase